MQAWLAGDKYHRSLRCMWWSLVQNNNQMAARMVLQHLDEKLDDFFRNDAFVVQTKYELG